MPTVWGAAARYVAARRNAREFSPRTAVMVRGVLARFADQIGPTRDVRKINERDIERWLASRAHVADGTLRIELSNVRTFFRWCHQERLIRADPTVNIRGPSAPRTVPRAIPPDRILLLLQHADARARLIVLLMARLGLRRLEVSHLQLGDLQDGVVHIRGKGGHERWLPVPTDVRCALDGYLAEHPASAGPLIRSYLNPRRGLGAQTIGDLIARLMREAGVKTKARDRMSGHGLRHTAAQELLARGADVTEVQAFLGHANLSTTERYLRRKHATDRLRQLLED